MNWWGGAVLLVGIFLLAGALSAGAAAQSEPGAADPQEDVIGWENGYWHNESIAVDQSDGLSDDELDAFVSRTMARVEVIREREFNRTVPVTVIPRSEFGNDTRGDAGENFTAWNNQVWEALFIVGEGTNVQNELHATSTASTTGAYVFSAEEIWIVTDDPENPTIGRRTLAHELVHAQQDQYVDLANLTAEPDTQDEYLATLGLTEGEANYVEARYEERCGQEWECVPTPPSSGGSGASVNQGIQVTLLHPYSDGPPYVRSLVNDGGWAAVDAAYRSPPNSTEQVIHHVDQEPRPLSIDGAATAGWEPFPGQGRNGTDVAGEASIFAMLWYQALTYDADTVPLNLLFETTVPYDTYNYVSRPSSGWANDAIHPHRKETPNGTVYGYVWVTEWETPADSSQFRSAYLSILDAHDACRVGSRTWVIESGPFADAFRVVQEQERVTVVNAPRVADLGDIRPNLTAAASMDESACDPPSEASLQGGPGGSATTTAGAYGRATPSQPGFGALAALVALGVAAVAGRRWRDRDREQGR